jgi:hypothetical protein
MKCDQEALGVIRDEFWALVLNWGTDDSLKYPSFSPVSQTSRRPPGNIVVRSRGQGERRRTP